MACSRAWKTPLKHPKWGERKFGRKKLFSIVRQKAWGREREKQKERERAKL